MAHIYTQHRNAYAHRLREVNKPGKVICLKLAVINNCGAKRNVPDNLVTFLKPQNGLYHI